MEKSFDIAISLITIGLIIFICSAGLIYCGVKEYRDYKKEKNATEYHIHLEGMIISSKSHIKINSIDMHENIEAFGK